MYEHGEPSEGFLVVDLSLGEDNAFPDTSRDEEIARKLFDGLNHMILGMPSDDNVIFLSDSDDDEEEEACKDDRADAEATPSSAGDSLAPTASATNDDDGPEGCKMIVVAVPPSIGCKMIVVTVEMRSICLRLPRQKGCAGSGTEEFKNNNDFCAAIPQILL
jgi:hypothetical protein